MYEFFRSANIRVPPFSAEIQGISKNWLENSWKCIIIAFLDSAPGEFRSLGASAGR